jgi:hypothetical protein
LIYVRIKYFIAAFVENGCCSGHPGKLHFRVVLSSAGINSMALVYSWWPGPGSVIWKVGKELSDTCTL